MRVKPKKVIWKELFRKFAASKHANTTVVFAGALPALLGSAGLALDFATFNLKRNALQSAADMAAMAGAKEMAIASASDTTIMAAADRYSKADLATADSTAVATVTINRTNSSVTVKMSEPWVPFFAHFISATITPVVVDATATLQGGASSKLCILALNETDKHTFRMMNSAKVTAPSCSVNSNSTDADGMFLQNFSVVTASRICSAGGVKGNKTQTNIPPITDCPKVPDPLSTRMPPSIGSCTANNLVITGVITLSPGVYCGGLEISGNAIVKLLPGTYVIQNGPFKIAGNATVTGSDTSFYLTGANAALAFRGNASIDLSGAEVGDMAGLLIYADRNNTQNLTHEIDAKNVKNLTGTIYIPSGDFLVDPAAADTNVGEKSAYTAIIANHVRVERGPELMMNTNYGGTSVPVPEGIRSTATVVLVD